MKQSNRCPSLGGQWFNDPVAEPKMLFPHIISRVKQEYRLRGQWIQRCDITAFEAVTVRAAKAQIAFYALTAVLGGKDVINFKRPVMICSM